MSSAGDTPSNGVLGGAGNGLSDCVREVMEQYFRDLDGHDASGIHELVLAQVEKPLFEIVMKHARGNISHASQLLGLNRATLRNRLRKYGLDK